MFFSKQVDKSISELCLDIQKYYGCEYKTVNTTLKNKILSFLDSNFEQVSKDTIKIKEERVKKYQYVYLPMGCINYEISPHYTDEEANNYFKLIPAVRIEESMIYS